MPALLSFDYALIRVVPHVDREEFLNAGVILYAQRKDFLAGRVGLADARVLAVAPDADLALIQSHLAAIPRICAGGPGSGPIGRLSQKERWHWLVAPRSTVIQVSPVHAGLCAAPAEALDRLFDDMVATPRAPSRK